MLYVARWAWYQCLGYLSKVAKNYSRSIIGIGSSVCIQIKLTVRLAWRRGLELKFYRLIPVAPIFAAIYYCGDPCGAGPFWVLCFAGLRCRSTICRTVCALSHRDFDFLDTPSPSRTPNKQSRIFYCWQLAISTVQNLLAFDIWTYDDNLSPVDDTTLSVRTVRWGASRQAILLSRSIECDVVAPWLNSWKYTNIQSNDEYRI